MADISQPTPPRKLNPVRRWAAAAGGNRLDRLHQLLVGDANTVATLPPDHPRRKPTQVKLKFLLDEESAS
jgi:hypothetical protein